MKPIKLNGMKLRNGQLIVQRGVSNMLVQRKLNSSSPEGMARDGRVAKRLTDVQPVPGMTRREDRGGHPLAGPTAKRPLDDLPLEKNWQGKGNVPTAFGMDTKPTPDDKFRGTHDRQMGNKVLADAANLGRK